MIDTTDNLLRAPRAALPAAGDVILRPAVADVLGAARGRAVAVSAPAGWGKTAQVALWARVERRPVAWVDLEAADDDPHSMLAALLGALWAITDLPSLPPTTPFTTDPHSIGLAPSLGDAVAATTEPFVLVLDDTHVVDDPSANDLIDAIAYHLPAGSTLVLISRATTRASLLRLRGRGGLTEVGSTDLALDDREAGDLLAGMGVVLDDEALATLVERTEGWPVGIRIAGLMAQEAGVAAAFDTGSRSTDRGIRGYLIEEWLRGLAPDARTVYDEARALIGSQHGVIRPFEQSSELERRLRMAPARTTGRPTPLTTAELRVLHYLPTNLSLSEIAERLYVSRNTTKSHAASVYRKLGASSRSEAVELARAAGLVRVSA